jgi:glycosyltransferase involved in cell wall biosynthesis
MAINVSIIITNYNYGKYLGRCIRSCLDQSMDKSRYEVVVVDDASTDESAEVINSFGDKIRPVFLKENRGVSYASNVGIREALGFFIIRVDADDYINEHTLLIMAEILNSNQDIGFVYSDHLVVDVAGTVLKRVNKKTLANLLNHGAGIMFKKSHLEVLGLYNVALKNCEDYDLILRYLKNFDGYHIPLPFYRYTRHDTNMTNDENERSEWEKKVLELNNASSIKPRDEK